jgi:hypothetical protein
MSGFTAALTRAGAVALVVATAACGSSTHTAKAPTTQVVSPTQSAPGQTVVPTGSAAPPTSTPPSTTATTKNPAHPVALGATIAGTAFGMHWLSTANPYPALPFGAARIWDMGVTWAQLQPSSSTPWTASGNPALRQLDSIVSTFRAHGAEPMLTLGMTPAWAAHSCNHVSGGMDWGIGTCAPRGTSATSAWGRYVTAVAKRYQGKIRYYEMWNEPSLRNGYNDSITTLALMQRTAEAIVHRYGAKLISPSIPFTNGTPSNGIAWLNRFFHSTGGRSFDIFGVHLYPADAAARGGYGPEWSVQTGLTAARSVAAANGIAKPIWNTEMNIGRQLANTGYGASSRGAGMVARTYLLAVSSNVARTFWYAADDRAWGGTWLEGSDKASLTPAGRAYRTARNLLVGARPAGCTSTSIGTNKWHYRCGFQLADGRSLLAVWSTSGTWRVGVPTGTQRLMTSTGGNARPAGSAVTVGASPVYLVGSFDL